MATKQEDVPVLTQLASNSEYVQCCWYNQYQKNINGIGRVIFYRDKGDKGKDPDFMYYIWEGQL